ncbi:hypothetical protein FNV43_RR01967 [Rhamnella rubrinervis]|uniref:Uncharacterized protein n=1 Tax=Rhamnella rubrinervis TaxID=2594499 RepID=A0A8K0MTR1_9ROSA|nr:hypothetical protein FNV43_RR01967 [Rhamnella rubrinervis]
MDLLLISSFVRLVFAKDIKNLWMVVSLPRPSHVLVMRILPRGVKNRRRGTKKPYSRSIVGTTWKLSRRRDREAEKFVIFARKVHWYQN